MKTAYLTPAEFDALPEYSCSLPTGTIVGKRWKRDNNWGGLRGHDPSRGEDWYMGEYFMDETIPEGEIGIRWSKIAIGRPPAARRELPVHLL
jgi:hypothetical protein